MSLDLSMFIPILPEVLLLILGLVVLFLELISPKEAHRSLGWVTAIGAALIILLSLPTMPGKEAEFVWGGMLRYDWLSFTFKMLFLFAAGITALFAIDEAHLGYRGDFYLLMLASTLGMMFMASAADLVMLYLAIETTSIPLYILAGFLVHDERSTEAGFKYLLFGAMTSAIMLYGFSLLFGFSGTTQIYQLAQALRQGSLPLLSIIGSLVLILIGFGFKISAVPLHFWAPDVYHGAPTAVAGFLSTASKAAGFSVLLRVMMAVFPEITLVWGSILAAISVATMTLGNLVALAQQNIKRMLAYSSIAHAGYALIGLVSLSHLGYASLIFYLVIYLVTNLAAFGIVSIVGRQLGSDEMKAYYGLSRRSPGLALALLVALLSLAGMPPLGGFIAKFLVFAAAVHSGLIWLAFVGVLNSIVGLYYYLTVLKYVYLYRAEGDESPMLISRPSRLAVILLVLGIVVLGTLFTPWFRWAQTAAAAMF